MPAPLDNKNAIRHGLTSTKLPAGASYIRKAISRFRQALEDDVLDRFAGEISVYRAALISSACRHETRAQLLQRWLNKASKAEVQSESFTTKANDVTSTQAVKRAVGLGIMERAQLLREISAATDARDKCLYALGLNVDRRKNVIDATFACLDDCEATEVKPAASEATPEPQAAQQDAS